jgi:restriction system protein
MGYGATADNIEHLGGSGDEGVDGVIHHDQLGLDKIYIQAKRYKDDSTIGRPAIQSFVGALSGKKATRGVFIATTKFSRDAYDYVSGLTGFTVVLIDGNQLANFMIDNKVGVTVEQAFEVLALDENFFGEDF